jgi:hypothetical protein
MMQFEVPTRSEQVRMFSNFEQTDFITGQIKGGENIVHGERRPRISDEAEYWHVRPAPKSRRGELLLQFYAEGQRRSPWKEGLFFIINIVPPEPLQPPKVDFKLGNYDEALEKGIFIIQKH